jgi:tetrahedral aminopeptidase
MNKDSKDFLFRLLLTPSPTGYEQKIQKIVKEYVKSFAESVTTDLHGNVIIGVNTNAKRRVMLAGHCDQIGFMVKHITTDGFLSLAALGGIDTGVLQGSKVTIHSAKGELHGVIGRKPIHLQTGDERGRGINELDKMIVDIGAKNKKEVEKLLEIGDPVTFQLGITELRNDLITSPGLDDKVGVFVAVEALRLCAKSKLNFGLYAVSTVQEEVGLRGAKTSAYAIDPEIGIAIDVTHSNDNPTVEKGKSFPCDLGKGPTISRGPNVNPVLERQLIKIAKQKKIPYQLSPSSTLLGNDANAIQITKGGVAAGAIGVPNRYMHTQVEVCHLKDIDNAAKLLAEFVKSLNEKSDFVP